MTQEVKFIEKLQITKFFDVKTPVGVNQRGESLSNYSIGIDLYMPRITKQFLDALIEANKKLYSNLDYLEEKEIIHIRAGIDDKYSIASIHKDSESNKGKFIIDNTIQIPTGIGMNIPAWLWCEARTKSSNFQNKWTEVHGTIDMNYTYGIGVQIIPLSEITIESDQKFTQLVFHEAVPVLEIDEVSQDDWNNLPDVINKRGTRIGGFGSTGKFDRNASN